MPHTYDSEVKPAVKNSLTPKEMMSFIEKHNIPMIPYPSDIQLLNVLIIIMKKEKLEPTSDYERFYSLWATINMPIEYKMLWNEDHGYNYNAMKDMCDQITTHDINYYKIKADTYAYISEHIYFSVHNMNGLNKSITQCHIELLKLGDVDTLNYYYDSYEVGDDIPIEIIEILPELWDSYENMRPLITKIIYEYSRNNSLTDDLRKMLKESSMEWCEHTSPLFVEYISLLKATA